MKRNSRFLLFFLAAFLVGASVLTADLNQNSLAAQSPVALSQGPKAYAQDIAKLLKRHDKLELDPAAVAEQVRQTGRVFLPTSEGGFEISLAPRELRSQRYRAQETGEHGVRDLERGSVRTYKGTIAGQPAAQARFTIDKNTFEGLVITPDRLYFIEPASRYSAAASTRDFIVYTQSDLLQTSFGECGLTMAEKVNSEAQRLQGQTGVFFENAKVDEFFSPARIVDLATEADFEYFTFFGSSTAANNEIISIMNLVEGIYDTQFGLQFSLVFQNVWSTAGDPYAATGASAALDEFTGYWNANHGSLNRDLAHMWTGKSFDGSTIGIAWRPGLNCPLGQLGYGMSERLSSSPAKIILSAHEIGHNFNATHVDAAQNCTNTIMGTTLGPNTSQTFCAFSVTEIETHANAKVACLAQALTPGCTYSLSASGQSFGVTGGSGSVNVNTVGTSCAWSANSAVTWITINSGNSGTNSGTVNFTVAPNVAGFARSGLIRIAEQNFIVTQAGGPGCKIVPIFLGQEVINAPLNNTDCESSQRDNAFADQYSFFANAGELIQIEMSANGVPSFDTYLYLISPTGAVVAENDDISPGSILNSSIPVGGFFAVPVTGTYVIEATSYDPGATGLYDLKLRSGSPNTIQLNLTSLSSDEGFPRVDVRMIRSAGNASAATVNYATSDSAGLTNCNVITGIASSRCDYASYVGSVTFAPGETTKVFSIPIVDDSYAEGTETFTLTLSGAFGSPPGQPVSATVTIRDNDASTGPNPIVQTAFFVRQHYIDFLGREPDPAGFQGWQDIINNCAPGNTTCDRVHVSGAFFQSQEFQERGYFVYRFYPVAFGRKPDYAEFIPDLARVSGFLTDAQLEAARVAFVDDFMNRSAFITDYNSLDNTQYVDRLLTRADVTTHPSRATWITALGNGTKTRAQVLRELAESTQIYTKYYNQAFVVMQYFGYLRRDPDISYLNWIQELNNTNNARNMINGFVNSPEYTFRFGP